MVCLLIVVSINLDIQRIEGSTSFHGGRRCNDATLKRAAPHIVCLKSYILYEKQTTKICDIRRFAKKICYGIEVDIVPLIAGQVLRSQMLRQGVFTRTKIEDSRIS